MEELSNVAYAIRRENDQLDDLHKSMEEFQKLDDELNTEYKNSIEAQQLLGTVADENANRILDYTTGIINKTLSEVFPNNPDRISLERKIHGEKHPHINLKIKNPDGKERDIALGKGTGLQQIVSFLYRICLLEVTGGRKLIIQDELLSGIHPEVSKIIEDVMMIFAEGGFQFLVVDYNLSTIFGKTYQVDPDVGDGTGARMVVVEDEETAVDEGPESQEE